MKLSFSDIQLAKERLTPFIQRTKISPLKSFQKNRDISLFVKREDEQAIKSFKIRGALNKILSLTEEERARGLIAASAGNHAQGVALAAKYLKIKARVVMMETASQVKVSSTRNLGAEVILKGKNYDESYNHAQSIKGDSIFIHPFADPQIIAGQGTVALEIFEDMPELNSVVVAVGGGGLLSGISLALKTLNPSIKVYGVVWEGTPDFCRQFHQLSEDSLCMCKKETPFMSGKSGLTDGIAVKQSHLGVVQLSSQYVDDIRCVSEEDISRTIVELQKKENIFAEGSGVAALAGLLKYSQLWDLGKRSCAVISGANIDKEVFSRLLKKYGEN